MTGFPSKLGSRSLSTETKNVSRSRQQIRGFPFISPKDIAKGRHEETATAVHPFATLPANLDVE